MQLDVRYLKCGKSYMDESVASPVTFGRVGASKHPSKTCQVVDVWALVVHKSQVFFNLLMLS